MQRSWVRSPLSPPLQTDYSVLHSILKIFQDILPSCIVSTETVKISNMEYWKRTIRRTKKSGAAPVENLSSLLHVTERLAVASMSQKVWGCQKKYSNLPPHDKTQVLVFTAGFLALYFVYALRKWLQVKKRPTFLRARDRVDANTQEGRITK